MLWGRAGVASSGLTSVSTTPATSTWSTPASFRRAWKSTRTGRSWPWPISPPATSPATEGDVPRVTVTRRRFLSQGLGMVAGGLGGWAPSPRRQASRGYPPDIRVGACGGIFNGQDIPVASFLRLIVAREHPEYAALIHAGADVAQALASALAPAAAAETWRLDELARRRGFLLSTSDDPEILSDREEADRMFREALRVILPGTEFLRLYLDRLTAAVRTTLGRPAATKLMRMGHARVLRAADVASLLDRAGPERVALAFQPLGAFRRYTYYRYLNVWEQFRVHDQNGGVDLVVPTAGAFDVGLDWEATPTRMADQ